VVKGRGPERDPRSPFSGKADALVNAQRKTNTSEKNERGEGKELMTPNWAEKIEAGANSVGQRCPGKEEVPA